MRIRSDVHAPVRLLFAIVLGTLGAQAEFQPTAWQMRRAVTVTEANRYQRLPLPGEVLLGADTALEDVRLIQGGREVPYRIRKAAGSEVLAGLESPEVQVNAAQHTSSVAMDLGRVVTFDRVDVTIRDPFFSRTAQVSVSRDMQNWSAAGSGVLSRNVEGENLTIHTAPVRSRYLRVTLYDRDDPPLQISGVTLQGTRRVLEFASQAAGRYWLYYGSADAKAPVYDLTALRELENGPAREATVGAEERNPQFVAAKAVGDTGKSSRKQALVRVVALVAAGVLGLMVAGLFLGYRMRQFNRRSRRRTRRVVATPAAPEESATASLLSLRNALGESVQPEAPIRVRPVNVSPRNAQTRTRPLL